MTPYEVPLSSVPQRFQIQMGGATYSMQITWNVAAACWLLSLASADGIDILTSIPLQPGVDLLAQHVYLGIPGQLWVQSDGDLNKVPDFTTLGASGHLYYLAP